MLPQQLSDLTTQVDAKYIVSVVELRQEDSHVACPSTILLQLLLTAIKETAAAFAPVVPASQSVSEKVTEKLERAVGVIHPVRVLHTVQKTQDPTQQLLLPEQQSKIRQNNSLQGSQESSLSLSIHTPIIYFTYSQGCLTILIWFCIDNRIIIKKKE